MGENTVQVLTIMDDHLKAIERTIKGALNRFEAAGGKIDDDFINYFEEKTVDCVNKTCENFERSKASDNPGTSNGPMKRKIQDSLGSGTTKRQKRYEEISETALTDESESDSESKTSSVADPNQDIEDKKQSKLAKFACISGIPNKFLMNNEENQREILRKLCEKSGSDVKYEDINRIYKNGTKLIVKFQRAETRDMFFENMNRTKIWTQDIFELKKNEIPKQIVVGPHVIAGLI